jgi:hypothetical protein
MLGQVAGVSNTELWLEMAETWKNSRKIILKRIYSRM